MTMANLPDDILSDIFIRLLAKQLAQLRCVCKPWNALLSESSFVKSHLHHSIHNNDKILLFFQNEICFASTPGPLTAPPSCSPHLEHTSSIKLRFPINPQHKKSNVSKHLILCFISLYFETFDFVFYLHLMLHILELTNILSQALQRKDQDIVEAVSLVEITKKKLQMFRDDGFEDLLEEVYAFCGKYEINKVDMSEQYARNRREHTDINNQHHYKVDIFTVVLDMQLQEFRDRFGEINTELLKNMAALSPCCPFSQFDASKLVKLSMLYPYDFTEVERTNLAQQLDFYYDVVREDARFSNLNGIADLSRVMVETRKHVSYYLVYRLVKLALVLPVATATVERCFSAMKIVKSDLRNRIGDDLMNSALICAIEKEELAKVTNEVVIDRFHEIGKRRGQL